MPRAFLVRKHRSHWRPGPGGTVTPPPSPEQSRLNGQLSPVPDAEYSTDGHYSRDRWPRSSTSSSQHHEQTPPVSPNAGIIRPSSLAVSVIQTPVASKAPLKNPVAGGTNNGSPAQGILTATPLRWQDESSSASTQVLKCPKSDVQPRSEVQAWPRCVSRSPELERGQRRPESHSPFFKEHEVSRLSDDDPPSPTDSSHSMDSLKLGWSCDMPVEFVNGGHGIKNPFVQKSQMNVEESPQDLKSSVMTSTQEDNNRLACKVCGKAFSLQRLLNRHMKSHSNVKRFLCTFCGKGFNDTFDLKRHTRTHTGVRPYRCALCEKSFTQRCSLESHTLKVHGIQHKYGYKERRTKVYVCEECGHITSDPEVHYVHLKDNHPYSPALLKFYDKRHFKFPDGVFPIGLMRVHS